LTARDIGRRSLFALAVAAAGSVALPIVARARSDGPSHLHVTRERLDALVAKFFPAFNEGEILSPLSAGRHPARHDVELRRITTVTHIPETGEPVEVSGLLALPVGAGGPLPVVSWQHGTILSFDQVPSNLMRLASDSYELRDEVDSIETLFNVHRFAGDGYAVIAADYLGKGPLRNGRDEAYIVREATVRCCLDVLQAGLDELERAGRRPASLFLNGWSQGALNTQWLQQALQQRGIPVAAAAAQSPFNDLPGTFRYWAAPHEYGPATGAYPRPPAWIVPCMILLLGSYRRYYGLGDLFETAIKPPYRAFAEEYWSDYRLDAEIAKAMPPAADLLTDGFFDRFTHDTNSALLRRLAANSTTFQGYVSPIRFYYGLADEALYPGLVTMALASGGPNIAGVPVKGASHRGTFLASLYGNPAVLDGKSTVLDWFNSLR